MTIAEFTENVNACIQGDIVYAMSVAEAYSSSLIQFDASTRALTVVSSTSTDAGTYTVTITGTIANTVALNHNPSASTTFTLTVT